MISSRVIAVFLLTTFLDAFTEKRLLNYWWQHKHAGILPLTVLFSCCCSERLCQAGLPFSFTESSFGDVARGVVVAISVVLFG